MLSESSLRFSHSMAYRAVIFDLFGTLVKGFNRQDYDPVIARMAEAFDILCQDVWDSVAEMYPARSLGHYDSLEANLTDMCVRAGQ